MVAVVRPEMLDAVQAVCTRWELPSTVIGEVTDSGVLRVFHGADVVGEIPARYLTDDAPRYEIPQTPREPEPPAPPPQDVPGTQDVLVALLGSDNIRSRAWIYERYDHIVGSRTVRRPGLDGAVLRLRPSTRGLAISLDATGRQGRLDPRFGGAAAVFEAARNVACAGGEPLAITDCLNYGNPEKPEIAWELAQGIEGISDACLALGIPVVSGNVSLYNETGGRPIHPTPTIGCVGLVPDVRHVPGAWRAGDVVLLAGSPALGFDGSEYQALYDTLRGCPPDLDLDAEAALVAFLWRNAARLSLAHDASEGGLAVALAEAALHSGLGAELDLPDDHRALFGEGGGQAVVACAPAEVDALEGDVPLRRIGVVGGDSLLGLPLDVLGKAWHARGEA
jgi:phosphoribosylformylglycinamidine synthase